MRIAMSTQAAAASSYDVWKPTKEIQVIRHSIWRSSYIYYINPGLHESYPSAYNITHIFLGFYVEFVTNKTLPNQKRLR
jgi:hypothetical protein